LFQHFSEAFQAGGTGFVRYRFSRLNETLVDLGDFHRPGKATNMAN